MNLEDIKKISEKYKIKLLELPENEYEYDVNYYQSTGFYFIYKKKDNDKKDNDKKDNNFDCSLILVSKEFSLVLGILYGIQNNNIKTLTNFLDNLLYDNIDDKLKEYELNKNKLKEYENKLQEYENKLQEMAGKISKYETENKILSNRLKELEEENKNKVNEKIYLKTILTLTNKDKVTDIIFNK